MTRRPRRRLDPVPVLVPVLVLALAGGLAGCGDEEPAPAEQEWTADGPRLDPTALTWAVDGTVHVGDAVVETGRPIEAYVVAGDSVWFLEPDDSADRLWRAGPDGVSDTGAHAVDLLASPDGRYLSFVDDRTGPRDRFDTPQARTVLVDLQRGRVVVRSTDGMGDRSEDDLADLYEDAEFGNLGFTDDAAWFDTADGVRGYDLASGDAVPDVDDRASQVYDALYRDGQPVNPDGTWVLSSRIERTRLRPVGGTRAVVPRTGFPSWTLVRWLADGRAVGVGYDAPPDEFGVVTDSTTGTLITCTVPDAVCHPVPGATSTDPIVLPTSLGS